jgi:hypothetical protein
MTLKATQNDDLQPSFTNSMRLTRPRFTWKLARVLIRLNFYKGVRMLNAFWAALTAVLSRVAPKMLPAIAARLTAMGATFTAKTVPAIVTGLKNWVGNNMGKVTALILCWQV